MLNAKGVILAGGTGSRLGKLCSQINKHMVGIYDQPMIYYPIKKLVGAGITDIMIITGTQHMGDFIELLGSGKEFGCQLTYKVQDEAGGIAQALYLAKNFCGTSYACVLLGDNIFQEALRTLLPNDHKDCAWIFLKKVPDPSRYGVACLNKNKIVKIEEKPKNPQSNNAVTGIYLFPPDVFDVIEKLQPSARGEYEITDVNNHYISQDKLCFNYLNLTWTDAGTIDSLFLANQLVKEFGVDY